MRSLRPELLFAVVAQAPNRTLLSLGVISKDWHHAATTQLYARVALHFETTHVRQFLETVVSNATLGARVKTFIIFASNDLHLFAPALRNMPNLEHLFCTQLAHACKVDSSCVDAVLSLRSLKSLGGHERTGIFNLDRVLDQLPPLEKLHWHWSQRSPAAAQGIVARSHDTLRELNLSSGPFDLIFAPGAVFSRLVTLVMGELSLDMLSGSRFPALRVVSAEDLLSLSALHRHNITPSLSSLSLRASANNLAHSGDAVQRAHPDRKLKHLQVHFIVMFEDYTAGLLPKYFHALGLDVSRLGSLHFRMSHKVHVKLTFEGVCQLLADENSLRVLQLTTSLRDCQQLASFPSLARVLR